TFHHEHVRQRLAQVPPPFPPPPPSRTRARPRILKTFCRHSHRCPRRHKHVSPPLARCYRSPRSPLQFPKTLPQERLQHVRRSPERHLHHQICRNRQPEPRSSSP